MPKPILINVGIGGWYPLGSKRLQRSFIEHGFDGEYNIWDRWPEWDGPKTSIYEVKAAALQHAINHGFRQIIWADCSVWAIKPVKPFVDCIMENGYWFGQSGYKISETATDAQLGSFDVTRDWADSKPDCASGLFGLNLDYPNAELFAHSWIGAAKNGAFAGGRGHEGQSQDPRFKFGRQDQSIASILLARLGMQLSEFGSFAGYKWDSKEKVIFACEGM